VSFTPASETDLAAHPASVTVSTGAPLCAPLPAALTLTGNQ
jgi:hypothetical protein